MFPRSRRVGMPALLLIALACSGCLEVDTIFTIYPDGSGRVSMSMTIDENQLEMLKGMAPPGMDTPSGGGPTQEIAGLLGKQKLRITTEGIFEDINQVKVSGIQASFRPGGDNTFVARLEIDPKAGPAGAPAGMGAMGGFGPGLGGIEPEPKPENLTDDPEGEEKVDPDASSEDATQAMAEQMLAGLKMRVQVLLPHAVIRSTGKHEGRRAWLTLDEKTMKSATGPIVLEAACEDRLADDAALEFEEFKAEIEAAKRVK